MATIEKRERPGKTVYRVKVRLRGYPAADATFDRITDAKRWAAETETAIRAGRWFQHTEARRVTLGQLIDRYEAEHLSSSGLTTKAQRVHRLKFWRSELGALVLTDITPGRIVEARAKLLKMEGRTAETLAPATVNQYIADLRHCFTIAKREFSLVSENPVSDVAKLKEPRGRVRFLSNDERDALLIECRAHSAVLHTVVVVALSTGARKGEILGLRWADVDLTRGTLTFHKTKNGERRTVPLVGAAIDAMVNHAKVQHVDSDFVFPGSKGHPLVIDKMFREACARAGVEGFCFHDLRHTAASWIAMNGGTLAEIAEVLGHKTLQMVRRYTHLTEGHTRGVLARMNDAMLR